MGEGNSAMKGFNGHASSARLIGECMQLSIIESEIQINCHV